MINGSLKIQIILDRSGQKTKNLRNLATTETGKWLRGPDLNQRPSGYEPDELPDCSTPRSTELRILHMIS